MNAPGCLLTERKTERRSRSVWESYVAIGAVGILIGIIVAMARMPMHLPGHKAIFWMIPIIAARMETRAKWGASIGTLVTAITALSLGGQISGGIWALPLVIPAGGVLDAGVQIVERRKAGKQFGVLVIGIAGLTANLICFVDRAIDPTSAFSLANFFFAAGSHAMFGLLAGLLGAVAGYSVIRTLSAGRGLRGSIRIAHSR